MIMFRGELSDNSKKHIIKLERKALLLAAILTDSIPAIIVILLSIYVDWIFVLAFIPLILILIVPIIPLQKKSLDLMFPIYIFIRDDSMTCKGKNFEVLNQITSVKKIIDYGEWYQIFFKFPYKCLRFLCQKDLIVEGTIEEFEKLFEGKIVRKTDKKSIQG